jgi:hypothetical protein
MTNHLPVLKANLLGSMWNQTLTTFIPLDVQPTYLKVHYIMETRSKNGLNEAMWEFIYSFLHSTLQQFPWYSMYVLVLSLCSSTQYMMTYSVLWDTTNISVVCGSAFVSLKKNLPHLILLSTNNVLPRSHCRPTMMANPFSLNMTDANYRPIYKSHGMCTRIIPIWTSWQW